MAGKLTYEGASLALDAALGRATVSSRPVYLALLTAVPDQSTTPATMTEATFTYTRPEVEFDAASGTPRLCDNTNEEPIGPLADADGTEEVTHWLLVSAQSGTSGEAVAYGDWASSRTPQAGDSLTVAAGDLDITVD